MVKHNLKKLLIKLKIWRYFYPLVERIKNEDSGPPDNFFHQFIREGDTCFDVGANVGHYTRRLLNCGAKVVAMEPQVDCVRELKRKFGNSIVIEETAVGDKEGREKFFVCEEATTISTFKKEYMQEHFPKHRWNKEISVPVTTLDILIKKFGMPKYCKIDVEGYELNVLKGLSHRIPYISFEIFKLDSAKECLERTAILGYREYNLERGGKFCYPDWISQEQLLNGLADILENKRVDIFARDINI